MKNIYKVTEGKVEELCNYDSEEFIEKMKECNWEDSALVHAETEQQALELSKMYDDRLIDPIDIMLDDGTYILALDYNKL